MQYCREPYALPYTDSAQIVNPVSRRQRHVIHLTIFKILSWPRSLYVHKSGLNPHSFIHELLVHV